VLKSVTPGQQIVKIIHDELVKLLGEGATELSAKRPLKVMLVGLHGSGKTTSTAKLGRLLKKRGYRLSWSAARPAPRGHRSAGDPGGARKNSDFYADRVSKDVPAIGAAALKLALAKGADAVLFDTAGRLQIDHDLIEEVRRLSAQVAPDEVLLVADGALGQEAVNVAKAFHEGPGADRTGADEARRRRPGRRGAVDQGDHRGAQSSSSASAKRWRISTRSTPTGWRRASSEWAMSSRSSKRPRRPSTRPRPRRWRRNFRKADFDLEDSSRSCSR